MENLSNSGHIAFFLGLITKNDFTMRQNQQKIQNPIFINSGAAYK